MPVVVNRREHKISLNLGNGKLIVLSGGETAKISDKQVTSLGVTNAIAQRDIAVLQSAGGSSSGSKSKDDSAEARTEKFEPAKSDQTKKPEKSDKKTEKDDGGSF